MDEIRRGPCQLNYATAWGVTGIVLAALRE